MIFDTHAHYDDERFAEDRDVLLAQMPAAGVGHIINASANLAGSRAAVSLAKKYPYVYGMVGVHPDEVAELTEAGIQELSGLAGGERIVAIGEIGLDYSRDDERSEKEREAVHALQKYWFRRQLELARRLRMPVNIHSRDAAADSLAILREHVREARADGSFAGGVIHCFAYSPEIAQEYLKMGFYLGIGGVVTFKNARRLPEVVADMPLSRIVLETDCPYLAPVPFRGKRNDSTLLRYVVEKIAELRGLTPEEVEQATAENARRMICGLSE